MIGKVKEKVKELLGSGEIKGFLGLSDKNGLVGPYLFCDGRDLDSLVLGDVKRPGDSRYPLTKQLVLLARHYPEDRLGVLARGCDERGLKVLFSLNQLDPKNVIIVGVACPPELAQGCECLRPYPDEFVAGEKVEACPHDSVAQLDGLDIGRRFEHWMQEFSRCIRCYGCKNICPVCFCKECSLTCDDLIQTGEFPPESPLFHLTRAAHMAGRCIDCGLCAEACPADIPLRTLYKKVADIIDEEFRYRPGHAADQKSPLNTLDKELWE